ncbi:chorismate lyase [Ectothiorhodospiraceae bacterium 2226]|nr:chorismate lyase [Ectothiorhodospiraceae bacterium 2226]
MSTFRDGRSARWSPPSRLPRRRLPAGAEGWLTSTDSLTRRVAEACGGAGFRVALLGQRRVRPREDERRLLGMGRGEQALLREVFLMCGSTPWVYARTVIPLRSLRGGLRRLAHLGERSLGSVLFADPATRRERVEYGALAGADAPAGARHDAALWGRRSVFVLRGRRLLVSEFFLPVVWEGRREN